MKAGDRDPGYVVVCEDGAVRHAGTFASRREARRWADRGHFCTNAHTVEQARSTVNAPLTPESA